MLQTNGVKLLAVLALIFSGCRSSTPPPMEVCILDGIGAGDCSEKDNSHVVKLPSQMKDYWCTNQEDIARFSAWAYQAPPEVIDAYMDKILKEVK